MSSMTEQKEEVRKAVDRTPEGFKEMKLLLITLQTSPPSHWGYLSCASSPLANGHSHRSTCLIHRCCHPVASSLCMLPVSVELYPVGLQACICPTSRLKKEPRGSNIDISSLVGLKRDLPCLKQGTRVTSSSGPSAVPCTAQVLTAAASAANEESRFDGLVMLYPNSNCNNKYGGS